MPGDKVDEPIRQHDPQDIPDEELFALFGVPKTGFTDDLLQPEDDVPRLTWPSGLTPEKGPGVKQITGYAQQMGRAAIVDSLRTQSYQQHPAAQQVVERPTVAEKARPALSAGLLAIAERHDPNAELDPNRDILRDSEKFVKLMEVLYGSDKIPETYLEDYYTQEMAYMKLGDETLERVLEKFQAMGAQPGYELVVDILDDFDESQLAVVDGAEAVGGKWRDEDDTPEALAISLHDPNAEKLIAENREALLHIPRAAWPYRNERWRDRLEAYGIRMRNGTVSDRKNVISATGQSAAADKAELVRLARESFGAAGVGFDANLVISSTDGPIAGNMPLLLQTDRPENPRVAEVKNAQAAYGPKELNQAQLASIPEVVPPTVVGKSGAYYHAKLGIVAEKIREDNARSEADRMRIVTVLVDNLNVADILDGPQAVGMFVDRWTLAPLLPDDLRYDSKFSDLSHYDNE